MTPHPDGPEVDFVNLARTIWLRRSLVVKLTGIAAIAGFLLSLLIPNRYTASVTFVQETYDSGLALNEAKLSAISSLAAIAGVDLHGLTKAKMSPKTYAMIVSSVPFRQELMKTKLLFDKADTAITLYEYYIKQKGPQEWINHVTRFLSNDQATPKHRSDDSSLPRLTREERQVNRLLDKQISLQLLDDEYISLRCTLPEAYAAAQLTRQTGELLQRYLIDIQTKKARSNLAFIQERYDEAKNNLTKGPEATRTRPASHGKMENEELAQTIYSDLAQKLTKAKIELHEQTPVFKIINPVTVPTGKSYPNRLKITIMFAFFGLVLALTLILGKDFFEETKARWNNG